MSAPSGRRPAACSSRNDRHGDGCSKHSRPFPEIHRPPPTARETAGSTDGSVAAQVCSCDCRHSYRSGSYDERFSAPRYGCLRSSGLAPHRSIAESSWPCAAPAPPDPSRETGSRARSPLPLLDDLADRYVADTVSGHDNRSPLRKGRTTAPCKRDRNEPACVGG